MARNKKRTPARLPAWGVGVQATLALGAVGAAGDFFAFSPLLGFGAGAVGAMCSVLRAAGDEQTAGPDRILIQLGRWSGIGGWLTWVWTTPADGLARFAEVFGVDAAGDPLSLTGMGTLAAGAQIGAHLSPRAKKKAAEPGTGLVLRATARDCEEWRQRIVARGGQQFHGTVVTEVTVWPNGAGKDVRLVLPVAGATSDDLTRILAGLANDANLPHGCTIELIEPPGEGQRTITLRVPTVNLLAENIAHPCPTEQRSILDGVPFGVHPNDDEARGPIREESWLVVGKRGAGKTTLLHGMTAEIGMCRDALVWHLDLNGGGMTQPWVDVWLDGRARRCPVDWAAPTVDEGLRMLRAAVAIAKHRKTAYRKRKKAHNTNLLPIGPDLPEIVIILDEGAEALEAASGRKVNQLGDLLAQLQRIARNEAVNLVISALRGTGDIVPAGMSTQTGVGICMKVKYQRDIAAVFEQAWELKLKPEHLISKGAGWVATDGGNPVRFQGWNILPDDMERVALRIAEVRPDLDEASARAAGDVYLGRYARMGAYFAEDAELEDIDALFAEDDPESDGGGSTAAWGEPADVAAAGGGTTVLTRPQVEADQGARGRVVAPILVEALAVFEAEESDRLPRALLAQRLTGGDEDALREALKDAGAGAPRPLRWRGQMDRGYHRADVEAAMGP